MSQSDLNSEQMAVVSSQERRLIVSASAGSGKTRVLVARCLRFILEDGLSPDQILTITYTRKAAAEMKSRIIARLNELGLTQQAQEAETGPIQTIHSFYQRMLEENALEIGIDPAFEILDEREARVWAADAITEAISEADEPEALELLQERGGEHDGIGIFRKETIRSEVEEVLKAVRGAGVSLRDFRLRHGSTEWVMENWRKAWLADTDSVPQTISFNAPSFDDGFEDAMAERLKQGLGRNPRGLKGSTAACRQSAAHTAGICQMAAAAWEALEYKMKSQQRFDFAYLEALSVNALRTVPAVQERLRGQYRVCLVDEAQDLNPVQHLLLQALDPEHLMLVGDPQQSIYAFRHSDVRLFREAERQMFRLPLAKSHRSKPDVQAFVDRVFSQMWSSDYRQLVPLGKLDLDASPAEVESDSVEVMTMAEDPPDEMAAWIHDVVSEGIEPGEIAVLMRSSPQMPKLVRALKQRGIESIIVSGGTAFYTRLEVRDTANALRCLCDPTDRFALLAVLRSPYVGIGFDSWILAADTRAAPLPPDFEACSPEDQEKIEQFRDWHQRLSPHADRMPAWELLSLLLTESPFLENLARLPRADATVANIRKLQSMAAADAHLSPVQFAERVRETRLRGEEPEAPYLDDQDRHVKIYTIHGAKGLEFPNVFVHLTGFKRPRRPCFDAELGLAACGRASYYSEWLLSRAKALAGREEERVAYVALTRSKGRLFVSVEDKLPFADDITGAGASVRDSAKTSYDSD